MKPKILLSLLLGLALITALAGSIYYQPTPVLSDEQSSKNIFIIAIPKSASTYILKSMADVLNYQRMRIADNYDTRESVHRGTLQDFFTRPSMITKDHFRAPNVEHAMHLGPAKLDLKQIQKYTNKIVVHIRDPREVLLSLVHYVNLHKELAYVSPARPNGYYDWELSRQIDWSIDNFLPSIVTWITDWVAFKDQQDSEQQLKILITTYDEMLKDEQGLYKKILAFYNIPDDNFNFKPPVKNSNVNFRKGDQKEWRSVYTEQQKQRIAEIVPDSLLNRFGWSK